LEVKPEAYEIPTVKAVVALHDNYELDVKTKEHLTPEKRREESDLLDTVIATDVMKETMKFLADKGYVPNDEYEFKDALKRIWFSQFKRIDGDASSSGFETVFLAEKFDNEIIGLHDWIYFAKQEEAKNLNYLGYIKKLDLGTVSINLRLKTRARRCFSHNQNFFQL
jgi:poly(U)-specific endoribonuclease